MRALVFSDSHGDSGSVNMLLHMHREADVIFFLGDGENDLFSQSNCALIKDRRIVAVCGNCDFASQLPKEEVIPFAGKKIYALHGHTKMVKYGLERLMGTSENLGADIVLYGHTHSPRVDYENGIYYMCPGSIHNGSYGIVDIDEKTNTAICYTAEL